MMAQRVGTTALRRVTGRPNLLAQTYATRLAAMARVSATSVQTRPVATSKLTTDDQQSLLAQQRLRRPVSPNLTIYDPMQTWFGHSAWTRITGTILSGSLYAFGLAYLAGPLTGMHLESASLAAGVAALPLALKAGLKFLFAFPFSYHAINGVRHLVFDFGIGFTRKTIPMVGWYVWGASLLSGLYLAMFM